MSGINNPMFGKCGNNHPKFGYNMSDDNRKLIADLRKKRTGEKASNVKLTGNDVLNIRSKYQPFKYSTTKLAKEYNVTQGTIMNIIKNRGWKHI